MSTSNRTSAVARHLAAFVIIWMVTFATMQSGQRLFGLWPASEAGLLLGMVFGVPIALLLRAPLAAYLSAAMVAVTAAELTAHLVYGIRSVQGQAHLALLEAALLAVGLGALLATYTPRSRAKGHNRVS